MPRKKKPWLTVNQAHLGREGALGRYWVGERIIEIDPRQTPIQYLDTLIHEILHDCFPRASERKIRSASNIITKTLWHLNYRQVWQPQGKAPSV